MFYSNFLLKTTLRVRTMFDSHLFHTIEKLHLNKNVKQLTDIKREKIKLMIVQFMNEM